MFGESCCETMTTSDWVSSPRMVRVASKPLNSGMLMSSTITSGFNSLAFLTTSRPFSASPQICQSDRSSSKERRPRRNTSWSSAMRMRTADTDLASTHSWLATQNAFTYTRARNSYDYLHNRRTVYGPGGLTVRGHLESDTLSDEPRYS